MKRLSVKKLCSVVNGELLGSNNIASLEITKIITDSRTFFGGEDVAYIALKGPVYNGHSFIKPLQKKGICIFIVSEITAINNNACYILVKNTTLALQKTAAYNRSNFSIPVIGITGSNGKTIIKEWLYDLLSNKYNIIRSPKSFNSQIGVPLSVLLINAQHNLGIFEAGISQRNEMQQLTSIIQPDWGILTNIGDAHQENFDTTEEKLNEKLKLFKHCKNLVFRNDQPYSNTILSFCKRNTVKTLNWSFEKDNSMVFFSKETKKNCTALTALKKHNKYTFQIPFTDESAIENACHCFTLLLVLEKHPEDFLENFEKLQPVAMRLEINQGINNCLLINDYYNSDLNSLRIALSVLNQQAAKNHLRKEIILSDIQQTGTEITTLYKKVNKLLSEWGINKLIGIGPAISSQQHLFKIDAAFYQNPTDFTTNFNRSNFNASAILLKGARQFQFERVASLLQQKAHQTVLEINLNAVIHNLNTYRSLLQSTTKIMVMVKAFSYGSGDVEIAQLLQHQNIDYLAVAVADEGVHLRNAGISVPIVVMNPEHDSFQNIIDFGLEPNIYCSDLLLKFSNAISTNGKQQYPVHLKIDTGMNRLGFKTTEEIKEAIISIKQHKHLKVKSVFSHLAGSDDPELDEFTEQQFARFDIFSKIIERSLDYTIEKHILNSAGIERFPERQMDMVRLGIGLYGVSQSGLQLAPIGTLKSTISQVKNIEQQETVGYSRSGKLNQTGKIAIVPLGYADGLDRKLGNKKGHAFVKGCKVPIIGNICMDMLMLDVTGVDVKTGDPVEFFGPNISITDLAEQADTIPYEILTGISQRVKRIYIQE